MKDFLIKNIEDYLVSLGMARNSARGYARKGADHFESSVCNSRDPFKESCDYAGKMAEREIKGFKYKSPKAKGTRRNKRPQEAFNFGDMK